MRCLRLLLAYDGTAYSGWQVQEDRTTVQGVLERALEKITRESIRVLASGRTDAGVHALGQVVGFRTENRLPADVLQRALNAELPRDVAVLEAADAPDDFHPIRDAVRKRYRYVIADGPVRDVFGRRYIWQFTQKRLDAGRMDRAAEALRGKHDFGSFETSGSERADTIRTVSHLSVARGEGAKSDLVTIEVEADGFLYNMVRTIVGTLVEVGRAAQPECWVGKVVSAVDRRAAGPTAPPQGLFLVCVDYQGRAGEPCDLAGIP